jgi:hypothetical protein
MNRTILRSLLILALACWLPSPVWASPVDLESALDVAAATLAERGATATVRSATTIEASGKPLVYLFELDPTGFVVIAGDTDLPPVIAYSWLDPLPNDPPERDIYRDLVQTDLELRLTQLPALPSDMIADRHTAWDRLLAAEDAGLTPRFFQQWPPSGSTATGGWLEVNWHQNAPYNDQCPLDPVAGGRSLAGCPAVAMATIVDYNRSTNGTRLDDSDDYYHSYSGRQYWIDDDWATLEFPSFTTLSDSLAILDEHYRTHSATTDADAAALVFACGVAERQVYTASASGTFGVDQAVDGYLRFGVNNIELVLGTDPDFYSKLSADMMSARPAHLAVLNPTHTAGHNLVVDGVNTDSYYHLNFGWGGTANGWYLLPDEIPYGLTVIDGVIVNIRFSLFQDDFEDGTTDGWSTVVP